MGSKMIETNLLQTWKSKSSIPNQFRYWSSTVKDLNPQFEYYFWDDADNRAFIEEHYPWFLKVYDRYPIEIYRVDAVRYFWLYHFGGVYIDMDSECLRPLIDLCLNNTGVVLGRMGDDPGFVHSIPNAVMMSSSREGFWLYVIHLMMDPQSKEKNPEDLTGSIILKAAVDAFLDAEISPKVEAAINSVGEMLPEGLRPKHGPSPLRILPPDCFYPVNWADPIHQKYFRKRIIKDGQLLPRDKVAGLFPNSYIVTYWAHSWDYAHQ
jgi:inositol phosphorylceramide mannosyltransferase catalytic subunit